MYMETSRYHAFANTMDNPQMHKYLMAPLMKRAIASSDLIGGTAKVPMLGMSVSPAVLIGSSVGAASIV